MASKPSRINSASRPGPFASSSVILVFGLPPQAAKASAMASASMVIFTAFIKLLADSRLPDARPERLAPLLRVLKADDRARLRNAAGSPLLRAVRRFAYGLNRKRLQRLLAQRA